MIFALLYEDGGVLTLEAEQSSSKKVASLFVLLTSCCDVFCLSNRVTEYAALLKVREGGREGGVVVLSLLPRQPEEGDTKSHFSPSLPPSLPQVFKELLVPAFLGQATVIFTLLHLFCYLGMYLFGGRVSAFN